MSALKAIQTSYFPVNPPPRGGAPPPRRKRSILCLSRSNGSNSDSSDGDMRKQEILARIVMLQTQKVRLTDFLDERSAYLTQFAEDANAEFEQIGEDALKELDEASARIMGKLDARMQAFEETAEENKREIERSEKILEEFEEKVERDRNEGLFFQSLGSKKPRDLSAAKMAAKMEAKKLKELEKEKAGSKGRKGVYLALMGILGVAIADAAFAVPAADLRKVAAFGFLFLALLAQYVYELRLSSGADEDENKLKE
ncbi:8-amino-7-oxononanoate synthase [Wolffia australiana]